LRQGISDEAPFADFREYVEMVLGTLTGQGLGLLLMLDEFDKLQEGIDKGVTSPQVPENIRFLVQTYPKFSAILTGSRRLKRLREEYWSALFGLGTRFSVSALPRTAAERLLTDPVKGRIAYAKDASDLAYGLTAGQPYLLQCLCNRIFDIAARTGVRAITVDQVREAGKALVEDNEHFASLWDYTLLDRRRFLLALLHREAKGPDALSLGVIEEKLSGYGIEIREETLILDLDYLRELELIDLHGETRLAHYTLTIPMMGDWIERQQDFDVLKSRARAESEDSDE
jgi:type I restriction enzyme M protein